MQTAERKLMENNTSKISVILSVYNVERYLNECIDSILNQTFKDFELICINDSSTDSSLDILNDYAARDGRIRVFTQPNGGASSTRNYGMKQASGDYLLFLDSDDYFDVTLFEKLYNKASLYDVDVVVTSYKLFDDTTKEVIDKRSQINKKFLPDKDVFCIDDLQNGKFSFLPMAPWAKMYKRDFILSNGLLFQDLQSCTDVFFTYATIALAEKICIVDENLIFYRINRLGSITSKRGDKSQNIIKAYLYTKEFFKQNNLWDKYNAPLMQAFAVCFRNEVKNIELKEDSLLFFDAIKSQLSKEDAVYFCGVLNKPLRRLLQKIFSIEYAIQNGKRVKRLTILGKNFYFHK